MDIRNKRIPDAEFEALRSEVLTQWPTGRDVNLDEAVAYAKQRKTFGKPIIAHQGIQFMLADMEIQITAARALVWQYARMLDSGIHDSKFSAVTKTFVSDTAMKVTTDAVQILGGYGYSREKSTDRADRK